MSVGNLMQDNEQIQNQTPRYPEDDEQQGKFEKKRTIRPFTNQRKNNNFFCSVQGAVNSAI